LQAAGLAREIRDALDLAKNERTRIPDLQVLPAPAALPLLLFIVDFAHVFCSERAERRYHRIHELFRRFRSEACASSHHVRVRAGRPRAARSRGLGVTANLLDRLVQPQDLWQFVGLVPEPGHPLGLGKELWHEPRKNLVEEINDAGADVLDLGEEKDVTARTIPVRGFGGFGPEDAGGQRFPYLLWAIETQRSLRQPGSRVQLKVAVAR